ncbi:CAP domain-containing protein [Terrisporobacter muris]|uniref:CAP domain-containing protein n=1 Tax=Terrisporobacter muris TaxID=2963284 RepID=A0A9X2M6N6_9FIRM|nr:CAP domain-containing protein [Terrisporobacter muris]MCR1821887.1 CAP domain-containing protein [Terrisporobacter muris]
MVRRNKKISSIVLVIGLALGTIGCNNNVSKEKEITTPNTSKVESSISKNNIEKKENNKDNSTLYEKTSNNNNEKVNENKKNIEESNVDSKPNKPSNGNSSNDDNNKPSKPSNDNDKPVKRTWKYMSELSQQTFRALNSFRKANGVEPLKYSSSEQARANEQAKYNARTETGGHDFMQISITSTVDKTAQQFINTWAGSSGHRASMLDSTNVEGAVSVYRDSEGCYYVVASFNDNW